MKSTFQNLGGVLATWEEIWQLGGVLATQEEFWQKLGGVLATREEVWQLQTKMKNFVIRVITYILCCHLLCNGP